MQSYTLEEARCIVVLASNLQGDEVIIDIYK